MENNNNYIKFLQDKIQVLEAQIALADWMNDALLDYAQSDKFQGPNPDDRLVNVNDIHHRADLTRQALNGCLDMRDYQECFEEDGTIIA